MRAVLIVFVALVLAGCSSEPRPDTDTGIGDPLAGSTPTTPTTPADPPSPSAPDTPDTPESDDPDAPATSAAGPPCDVVTDRAASAFAGTPQTVSGPQQVGTIEQCITVVGADDSLGLTWSFGEAAPLEMLVEAENRDNALQRRDIELDGGAPAALLTGQVIGAAYTQVITVLDDGRSLVVEARDTGLAPDPLSTTQLSGVATKIAQSYTR